MSDNTTIETPTPNQQFLDAVKASNPSAARDTTIDLLQSGAVNVDSSIGDLARALDSYNTVTPQQ